MSGLVFVGKGILSYSVSVLGNVLYVGLSKIMALGLTMSPLKTVRPEEISLMGEVTGQLNWFAAVCAAVPKFQFGDQFKEPSYSTWCQQSAGEHSIAIWVRALVLSFPQGAKASSLRLRFPTFQRSFACSGEGCWVAIGHSHPNTSVGCAVHLLEQNHKTLAVFL